MSTYLKKFIYRISDLRGLFKSIRIALRGIFYLVVYHRNMRLIFFWGIITLGLGFYIGLKGIEMAILCASITFVFIAEMFNTAIELIMDILNPQYNSRIKLVKDIAAGAVLIVSINAMAVMYLLFIRKLFRS